jgi:general L-amino acid transport system permease protein
VIFPQALRAIVPSLANQYLNLAKNSSLAIAVGYPDLYAVSSTTFNQTGRAVEVMLLICVTYLLISLFISLLMNVYNRTVQVIER